MQHVILFYLIFCFGILTSSVFVFALFYSKYKLHIIKYYLLLIVLFVSRLFIFIHAYYIESIIDSDVLYKSINVILRFAWCSLFILLLPRFFFTLVETRMSRIKNIFVLVAAVSQYALIVLPFFLHSSAEKIHATLEILFVYGNNSAFALFLAFALAYGRMRYRKVKNALLKKLLGANTVLVAILIPVLIVDMLEKGGATDVLPNGLLLIYVYSAVYSLAGIKVFYGYFMHRIQISVRLDEVPESFLAAHGISDRESEVLKLLVDDYTYKKIAEALFISERTVESHVSNIFRKTNVKSRNELIELMKVANPLN